MIAVSFLRTLLHLFRGLATCAFLFPLIGEQARQAHIRRWSVRLLSICGVRVEIVGVGTADGAPRALIVSNHVSWLDIFVINTLHPCRFVAKSDIRDWPLIGWLCEKTGTIFISRGKRRDVRRIYEGLVASLHAGEHVAFFPEGTTSAQGTMLPFHANLFEAAIEADVPVRPLALRYFDGQGALHRAADFVGDMTFMESLLTVFRSGGMTAQLHVLPVIETGSDSHRRALAEASQAAIATALKVG